VGRVLVLEKFELLLLKTPVFVQLGGYVRLPLVDWRLPDLPVGECVHESEEDPVFGVLGDALDLQTEVGRRDHGGIHFFLDDLDLAEPALLEDVVDHGGQPRAGHEEVLPLGVPLLGRVQELDLVDESALVPHDALLRGAVLGVGLPQRAVHVGVELVLDRALAQDVNLSEVLCGLVHHAEVVELQLLELDGNGNQRHEEEAEAPLLEHAELNRHSHSTCLKI